MASLVWRIQRAILGSAGPEEARELLLELDFEYGRTPTENFLSELRKALFRSHNDEAWLRECFANVGADPDAALRQTISEILATDGGEVALREWLVAQEGGEAPTA